MSTEKSFSPISLLWYAIAMFMPVIYFTALTDNTNETHPIRVFIVCPILYAIAGYLAVPGKLFVDGKFGGKLQWVLWSTFVGLVEAALLVWAI